MPAAVLFDLDQTLVDQRTAAAGALIAWAAEFDIDDEAAIQRWHSVSDRHYARYEARELTFQDQRRFRVREFLQLDLDDAQADEVFDRYLEHYEAGWTVFDDVLPALVRARDAGLRIGVLTNGDHDQQARKLDRFGLTQRIDTLVASSTLPAGKPDPRAFMAALAAVETAPEDTLMVGDSLDDDVRGALACGITAIFLDRDGHGADGDVRAIRSLDELDFIA